MAEFVVSTDQLRSNADRIAALQRELDSVAVRLGAMQLGSVLQIKASTALIGRIGDCKWAAAHQSDDLGRLARGLDEIALIYDTTEKNLTEPKTQAQSSSSSGGSESAEGGLNLFEYLGEDWSWQDLVKWLGRKSVPFSLWAAINSFGKGDGKGVVDGFKNLLYAIGNGGKAIFNADSTWNIKLRDFMGFKPNGVGGWGESWQKFLDDMNLGKQTTGAGKVATICKWAGYALTFVSEGIDNYKENGLSWRFAGETVIEGSTYVGLSILAGVAAAAALPATAPAILVGAAAAGVVWLGDTVVEYFTGQDIGEWVSDLVYGDGMVAEVREWVGDRIEDAGEWVGDASEWVGDRIEDAGEWVGDRVEDAGEWVGDRIEDAGEAVDSFCSWVGGLFG